MKDSLQNSKKVTKKTTEDHLGGGLWNKDDFTDMNNKEYNSDNYAAKNCNMN